MKQPWYILRLLAIVLCIVFAALGSVIAQDEDSDPQPTPTDTGTPGLVVAANNLNVPIVPPPPQDAAGGSPEAAATVIANTGTQVAPQLQTQAAPRGVVPPILPDAPSAAEEELRRLQLAALDTFVSPSAVIIALGPRLLPKLSADVMIETRLTHGVDSTEPLRRQSSDVVYSYTNPADGRTFTVFSDASFVVEDQDKFTLMTGYFGYIADKTLVMFGERFDGTRYAIYDAYYSAYTVDGDVLIGNLFTEYTYDYDEDGTLLSLTDSDGGEYRVQVGDSGSVSITGPDGYSVRADESGAFGLFDEAGDLVVAGDLNDANYDEFAQFEASTDDTSGPELDNSGEADSSGDDGGGDNSSADDSGGDAGGDGGG